jgi:hypothetical protein
MSSKNGNNPNFGRFEFEDGSIYEGCFIIENDKKVRSGRGTLTFSSNSAIETKFEKYTGQWERDMMNGFGIYEYINGAKYTGQWKDNKHHGNGKYEFPDGSYYEGDWVNHLMHGEGTFVSPTKQSWTGEFREGNFNSKMQNDLKAQKRIEVKKKIVRAEVIKFLKQMEIDLCLEKKILKIKIGELFAVKAEEEVILRESILIQDQIIF